jgi:homoserine O-acetyltransferase
VWTSPPPPLGQVFERCREHQQKYLVFSIDSDVCFHPEQQDELCNGLREAGVSFHHITVHSQKGHDSFLLEPELYAPHLDYALTRN